LGLCGADYYPDLADQLIGKTVLFSGDYHVCHKFIEIRAGGFAIHAGIGGGVVCICHALAGINAALI